MPRTRTPLDVLLPLASACPSTSGTTEMTPVHARDPVGDGGVVGERACRSAG